MTLRDNYSEIPTRTSTAVAGALGKDPNDPQRDDWAFQYINISYLQSIMEAFDDDGSGYVTVTEVNRFIDMLPPSIGWRCVHTMKSILLLSDMLVTSTAYLTGSLIGRLVYLIYIPPCTPRLKSALGWQQAAAGRYCLKITSMLGYMHKTRHSVLPSNRYWVEYYLGKVWQTAIKLCHSLAAPGDLPPWLEEKFEKYVSYEEERIKKNLLDVRHDIDALDTVYIVAGPGRIEKVRYLV